MLRIKLFITLSILSFLILSCTNEIDYSNKIENPSKKLTNPKANSNAFKIPPGWLIAFGLLKDKDKSTNSNPNPNCYSWGCFKDNLNGTITFTGAGPIYSNKILIWMKCLVTY